jgi:hypothetical protein
MSKLSINRTIINNPRVEDVVLGAFADTYLAHAAEQQDPRNQFVHHNLPGRDIEIQKGTVGRFLTLIREYNDLTLREITEPDNNLLNLLKAGTVRNIELQREQIWSIEDFS